MNVGQLRAYVREQMDVDSTDLPDSRLNIYLQEAFDRTIAFASDWPRLQYTWDVSKGAGDDTVTLPADLDLTAIMSVVATDSGQVLFMIDHNNAEASFATVAGAVTAGIPVYASVWNGLMYLWPRSATDDVYNLTIRGYRQPVWSNAEAGIPDIDSRLHATLAYFALSLAYAREEDEVMEGIYLARWNRDLKQQLTMIRRASHAQPMIYGGSPQGGIGPAYVITPPELP